jgi:hypothetical protein
VDIQVAYFDLEPDCECRDMELSMAHHRDLYRYGRTRLKRRTIILYIRRTLHPLLEDQRLVCENLWTKRRKEGSNNMYVLLMAEEGLREEEGKESSLQLANYLGLS